MSPKLPRNITGKELVKLLQKFEYDMTRQKGSHIRMTKINPTGSHHVTIPDHDPLKLGTLSSILNDVADHLSISKDDLISKL